MIWKFVEIVINSTREWRTLLFSRFEVIDEEPDDEGNGQRCLFSTELCLLSDVLGCMSGMLAAEPGKAEVTYLEIYCPYLKVIRVFALWPLVVFAYCRMYPKFGERSSGRDSIFFQKQLIQLFAVYECQIHLLWKICALFSCYLILAFIPAQAVLIDLNCVAYSESTSYMLHASFLLRRDRTCPMHLTSLLGLQC